MIAAHNGEVRTTGSTQWGGVTSTLAEADGDLDANAPEMRRVDILVDVHERSLASGPFTESAPGTGLSRCWSINVDVIDAVAGAAGTIGLGEIRNLETNQSVEGRWLAGGGGAGFDLPVLPSVSPGAWTGFETISPQSLSTFEGCPIRFSAFSAGLGAGYGIGYLRFIGITDEPIVLRGLAINQWGAGGSVTAGVWHFTEGIPEPPARARTATAQADVDVGSQYSHRLLFSTQVPRAAEEIGTEPRLSREQLVELQALIDSLP